MVQVPWNGTPQKVTALYATMESRPTDTCCQFEESGCLGVQPKVGGKFLLKLNNGERPIANKYRKGKMQRTWKRVLKVLEIAKREAIGGSTYLPSAHLPGGLRGWHGEESLAAPACRSQWAAWGGISAVGESASVGRVG